MRMFSNLQNTGGLRATLDHCRQCRVNSATHACWRHRGSVTIPAVGYHVGEIMKLGVLTACALIGAFLWLMLVGIVYAVFF